MIQDLIELTEQINKIGEERNVTIPMVENARHCAKLLMDLGLKVDAYYCAKPSQIQVRSETKKGVINLIVNEEDIDYSWHVFTYFKGKGSHELTGLHIEQLPSIVTFGAKKLNE